MSRQALTLFELIIVITVIFILAGFFAFSMRNTLIIAREEALRSELANLRMSLEYFRIINSRFPGSLDELSTNGLTGAGFDSSITSSNFLNLSRKDKEGFLVDPFMHRYAYDNKKGVIISQTERYKNW